jgi:hypothetical protein
MFIGKEYLSATGTLPNKRNEGFIFHFEGNYANQYI